MPITIILYRPENPQNLGSIARAASNFDFHDIVLIEPKCDVNAQSRHLAKHGLPTLERMRAAGESFLDGFDTLIMTHGREAKEYNMVRAPLAPRQVRERLGELDISRRSVGIVFGPEGEGLPPEMLRRADIIMAIPTSLQNPSMNLAQSVTVVLYELSLTQEKGKLHGAYTPMSGKERDVILGLVDECLDTMKWPNPKRKETQRLVWRRMIGRSFLTKREAFTVMGFLKRMLGRPDSEREDS